MKLITLTAMLALSVGSTLAAPIAKTNSIMVTMTATATAPSSPTFAARQPTPEEWTEPNECYLDPNDPNAPGHEGPLCMEDRKQFEQWSQEEYENCWGC
jgi:hypothetical protein